MIDPSSKYFPIEITTHNIYFHEESPIYSIDNYENLIATSGSDNTVRIWTVNFNNPNYKENTYKKIQDSSISINYLEDLKGFTKHINCVRFYKYNNLNINNKYLLAASSDGGKVILFYNGKTFTVRSDTGDDAYDLAWSENQLIIGFASGNIEIYTVIITNIDENINIITNLFLIKKIHENTIQGISYFNNFIATHSLDLRVKVYKLEDDTLIEINVINDNIDGSRGLFKRILLNDNFIYTFHKQNHLNVYIYPYNNENIYKKIGPLNSPVVKVLKNDDLLIICTKKSVYILDNDYTVCCVDNACFMAITDAFFYNNTVFVSSMDGFIATIRLNNK